MTPSTTPIRWTLVGFFLASLFSGYLAATGVINTRILASESSPGVAQAWQYSLIIGSAIGLAASAIRYRRQTTQYFLEVGGGAIVAGDWLIYCTSLVQTDRLSSTPWITVCTIGFTSLGLLVMAVQNVVNLVALWRASQAEAARQEAERQESEAQQ